MHFSLVTVSQNLSIPSTSSLLFLGLISRRMNSLSSCHIFSIGFKSGDSGGVRHQLMHFSSKNTLANFDVCLGSLSCISRCVDGNSEWMNGTRKWNIKWCIHNSIKDANSSLLIPAHTCMDFQSMLWSWFELWFLI